jgi:C_GCAxxG_C_C family probable redox protein
MDLDQAIDQARQLFLREDNLYGCAETTFMVLKAVYGLPEASDPAAAMALNGGVAYGGGVCGAISGAALAVGMLAERRLLDHRLAKRQARQTIAAYMDAFRRTHGSIDCRGLINQDLRSEEAHRRFIESGVWRTRCMAQIEFAVRSLHHLNQEGPGEG